MRVFQSTVIFSFCVWNGVPGGIRTHVPLLRRQASSLLRQGIHPKIVRKRLGHSTITTTLDIYSHVTPGIQEAVAARFDEAMSDGYNDKSKTDRALVANS